MPAEKRIFLMPYFSGSKSKSGTSQFATRSSAEAFVGFACASFSGDPVCGMSVMPTKVLLFMSDIAPLVTRTYKPEKRQDVSAFALNV